MYIMARFLPEYKEIDTRPEWEKVAMRITWVAFFLLIPCISFGYFAEKSLPGQILYPLKRGIEGVVLTMESISPYAKSMYLQTIANNRIQETSDLVAYAATTNSGDVFYGASSLDGVVFSVTQAQDAINQINDPLVKQKAEQQLATSIHQYQTQLNQIDYTIQKHLAPTPTPIPSEPISTPTPIPQNTNSQFPTPSTEPSPTLAAPADTSLSNLANQINNVQQQLQDISSTLPPVPTDTPIPPTPTLSSTPTPTSTPTLTPTSTPTPTPHGHMHHSGD